MGVRANAETVTDAKAAREFGAQGIGLARTEHMFFGEDRIRPMREMILAKDEAGRRKALAKLLPLQRNDFVEFFRIMRGYPVIIRLLDPPLHEFLPQEERLQAELAGELGLTPREVAARVAELHEANPMMGLRGCRLGLTYPEINEMQITAILEAACDCAAEGVEIYPYIMFPLVAAIEEMRECVRMTREVAARVFAKKGRSVEYKVGTMIELPRAALRAGELASEAEFFSFGTNDLTQMTYGFSRDDIGRSVLPAYLAKGLLKGDPFQSLDAEGVGELIRIGVERGKAARADISIGICGEHGGDPASIHFCHKAGLDYVSCSPYRVPVARLAAAHAALEEKGAQGTQGA
jgi:pyruvate,orthophosphate dikinase